MVMEMSKTYQYRKVMKPLLERKRRARINKCLDDLKDIMVECLQQEGEHVTRLEKADILELTVEHMRKLKRRGTIMLPLAGERAKAHIESFRTGYLHAADQITQVLLQKPAAEEVNEKIMNFLTTRLHEMQQQQQQHIFHSALSEQSLPTAAAGYAMQTPNAFAAAGGDSVPFLNDMLRMSTHTAQRLAHAQNISDELIDVTTVDCNSNSSFDSNNSESVWRPW